MAATSIRRRGGSRRWIVPGVSVALLLAACGSGAADDPAAPSAGAADPTPPAVEGAPQAADAEPASDPSPSADAAPAEAADAASDPSAPAPPAVSDPPAAPVESDALAASAAPAPTGEAIRFGFLSGLSGGYAKYATSGLGGATTAVGEINAAGGVLGRPAELVTEDNLSTEGGAIGGYSRIREEIDVLGGIESVAAEALLGVLATDEMPTMCPACSSTLLNTAGGNFLWRIAPSVSTYGVLSAQLARDLGYTRVAILAANLDPSAAEDPADAFREVWENKVGGEIVADVRLGIGRGATQSQIAQAFAGDPEAVYVAAGIRAAIAILNEYAAAGYEATILLSPLLHVPYFAESVEPLPAGRVLSAWATDAVESPAYTAFAAAHQQHAGRPPPSGSFSAAQGLYEANQFDQYIALALAMTAAGSTDGAAVAAQVPAVLNAPGTKVYTYADGVAALRRGEDIDYDGASGSLELNEYGNLVSPHFAVSTITNGAWSEIETIQLDPTLTP